MGSTSLASIAVGCIPFGREQTQLGVVPNSVSTHIKSSGDFSYRFHKTLHPDVYSQPAIGIANTFPVTVGALKLGALGQGIDRTT